MHEYIYILASKANGLYKIGRTQDPNRRLSQIRQSAESEVLPVALYRCMDSKEKEKSIHALLDDVRERGEWFRLNDEHLAHVANTPGLSLTTFEECKPRSTRPLAAKTGLISLRIPDELLAEIDLEAKVDDRSRNSTILRRLRSGHGAERVDEPKPRGSVGGGGNGAGLPVLPATASKPKRLYPVQPVRRELAERGNGPAGLPEQRPASSAAGSCPHGDRNQAYCRYKGGGC